MPEIVYPISATVIVLGVQHHFLTMVLLQGYNFITLACTLVFGPLIELAYKNSSHVTVCNVFLLPSVHHTSL